MANISSFYGSLTFETDGNPWTAEGYLLAYDVLKTLDCSGGNYGFCLDEEITIDTASFIAHLLVNNSINYWGSGRWSAYNVFDSFNEWSKRLSAEQKADGMDEIKYTEDRKKLLQLMYDNGWYLLFNYVDEETGVNFIERATLSITPQLDNYTNEIVFMTITNESEQYDHNLRNFCLFVIDGDVRCEYFYQVADSIIARLDIPETLRESFYNFFEEKDYDSRVPYYIDFTEKMGDTNEYFYDLPENLEQEWKLYKEALANETK